MIFICLLTQAARNKYPRLMKKWKRCLLYFQAIKNLEGDLVLFLKKNLIDMYYQDKICDCPFIQNRRDLRVPFWLYLLHEPCLLTEAQFGGFLCRTKWLSKIKHLRNFPSGPVVKTPGFHCKGHRFNAWFGNEDTTCHTTWPKKTVEKNIKHYWIHMKQKIIVLNIFHEERIHRELFIMI